MVKQREMSENLRNDKMKIIYKNEFDIVYVDLKLLESPDDVHFMWEKINEEVIKCKKRYIMVDLTRNRQKTISNVSRKAFFEHSEEYNSFSKAAYIVPNPIVRMLLRATIAKVDKDKIGKIFHTREEGLEWLTEKNNKKLSNNDRKIEVI